MFDLSMVYCYDVRRVTNVILNKYYLFSVLELDTSISHNFSDILEFIDYFKGELMGWLCLRYISFFEIDYFGKVMKS